MNNKTLNLLTKITQEVENIEPIAIAIVTSSRMMLLVEQSANSCICQNKSGVRIIPLINATEILGGETKFLEIFSRAKLYAIQKVDMNFNELKISSLGLLETYLDAYEDEYNNLSSKLPLSFLR